MCIRDRHYCFWSSFAARTTKRDKNTAAYYFLLKRIYKQWIDDSHYRGTLDNIVLGSACLKFQSLLLSKQTNADNTKYIILLLTKSVYY